MLSGSARRPARQAAREESRARRCWWLTGIAGQRWAGWISGFTLQ